MPAPFGLNAREVESFVDGHSGKPLPAMARLGKALGVLKGRASCFIKRRGGKRGKEGRRPFQSVFCYLIKADFMRAFLHASFISS